MVCFCDHCCNSSRFFELSWRHIAQTGAQIWRKKRDSFALFQVKFWNDVTREQDKNNRTVHREWRKNAKPKFKRKQNVHAVVNTKWKKNLSLMHTNTHTQREMCMRNSFYCFRWTHTTIGLFVSSSWSFFSLFTSSEKQPLSILSLSQTCFSYPIPILTEKRFFTCSKIELKTNEEWGIMRHCSRFELLEESFIILIWILCFVNVYIEMRARATQSDGALCKGDSFCRTARKEREGERLKRTDDLKATK